jgi:NAD(P)-dependent dehydrogenase (short-subunit alcohol dehydrogenase family)
MVRVAQKSHALSYVTAVIAVVGVVLPLLLSYISGGRVALYVSPPYRFSDIPDLSGKVAIVTGSNTGIGYVTARELARKGAHVIATARNDKRGLDAIEKMKSEIGSGPNVGTVEFMKLDLSSFGKVQTFAKEFLRKKLKVDILILNAGVMMPPYKTTKDGFELQVDLNFTNFHEGFKMI